MKMFLSMALVALTAAGTTQAAESCDSQCLRKIAATYIRALEENKPQQALLSDSARLVEDGKVVKAGEGFWKKRVKLRSQQLFTDPVKGGVALYGAAEVGGKLNPYYLRLKVAGGKVTESEIYSQDGEEGAGTDNSALLEPDLIYVAPVPPERRSSRADLQRIVRSYLDAISNHDPKGAPFSPRCDRYASGRKFTNNLEVVPVEKGGGSCGSSLLDIKAMPITDARFSVLDESLGIVAVEFIIASRDQTPAYAFNIAEVFKVVDGKIRSIEEFALRGPSPLSSGFEPDR